MLVPNVSLKVLFSNTITKTCFTFAAAVVTVQSRSRSSAREAPQVPKISAAVRTVDANCLRRNLGMVFPLNFPGVDRPERLAVSPKNVALPLHAHDIFSARSAGL